METKHYTKRANMLNSNNKIKNIKTNGTIYLLILNVFFLSIIFTSFFLKKAFAWYDILIAISLFLFAYLIEYRKHSGPMHFKEGSAIHTSHAINHHSFFTHKEMFYQSSKEYHFTLNCPKVIILNLFINVIIPAICIYFINSEYGLFYLAIGTLYLYINEMLHFYYHLDENSFIVKLTKVLLPFIYSMRKHHKIHHDKKLMENYNFGITSSFYDVVFNTKYKKNHNN